MAKLLMALIVLAFFAVCVIVLLGPSLTIAVTGITNVTDTLNTLVK